MTNERASAPFPPLRGDLLLVGDCEVDFLGREVRRGGEVVAKRVGVKSLQVLDLLAQHAGKVVTRQECLNFAWPTTLPTDDVLTQAVKGLRRALADEDDEARVIETVSRVGYRLKAPVEWRRRVKSSGSQEAMPPAPPREVKRLVGLKTAVAGWAILISAVAAWIWQEAAISDATRLTDPQVVRVASGPDDETHPRLSPDGTRLALVLPSGAIWLQPSSIGSGRAITQPVGGARYGALAWEPNGARIAYQRVLKGQCRIFVVEVDNGESSDLAPCLEGSDSLDWSLDGTSLIASGRVSDGGFALFTLKLPSVRWRRLPIERLAGDEDRLARYSPDGRHIAFVRSRGASDVWIAESSGGNAKPVTRRQVDVRGLAWTPKSDALILSTFFRQSGGPNLGLLRLQGMGEIESVGVYAEVGRVDMAHLSNLIVYEELHGESAAFEWQPGQPKRRLAASSGSDLLPNASPDHSSIAFYSNRSGDLHLWIMRNDERSPPRMLGQLIPIPRHPPQWSKDGKRIVIAAIGKGGFGLYEVDATTGISHRLPMSADDQRLAFMQDGLWHSVSVDKRGHTQLVQWQQGKGNQWQPGKIIESVADARPSENGIYFSRSERRGIFKQPSYSSEPIRISQGPALQDYRAWAEHDGLVWWLERNPWRLHHPDGEATPVPLSHGEDLLPVLRRSKNGFLMSTYSQQVDVSVARYAMGSQ